MVEGAVLSLVPKELVCDPPHVGSLPSSAVANGSVTALAAGLWWWDGCVAGSLFPPTEGWGLAWGLLGFPMPWVSPQLLCPGLYPLTPGPHALVLLCSGLSLGAVLLQQHHPYCCSISSLIYFCCSAAQLFSSLLSQLQVFCTRSLMQRVAVAPVMVVLCAWLCCGWLHCPRHHLPSVISPLDAFLPSRPHSCGACLGGGPDTWPVAPLAGTVPGPSPLH